MPTNQLTYRHNFRQPVAERVYGLAGVSANFELAEVVAEVWRKGTKPFVLER